jgi:hypothetical protein
MKPFVLYLFALGLLALPAAAKPKSKPVPARSAVTGKAQQQRLVRDDLRWRGSPEFRRAAMLQRK